MFSCGCFVFFVGGRRVRVPTRDGRGWGCVGGGGEGGLGGTGAMGDPGWWADGVNPCND